MKIQFVFIGLLFVLLNILSNVNCECGEGCISCVEDAATGNKSCSICDIYHFYSKSNLNKCEKVEIDNCQVPSLNRLAISCLLCQPNYILDLVQGKCVSVALSKIIPDCERYTQNGICNECSADHYIFAGGCLKSEVLVENCEKYSTEGICSSCVDDFFLDSENNVCSEFPRITNCKLYNTIGCDQCSEGFSQDLNFYMRKTLTSSDVEQSAVFNSQNPLVIEGSDNNCFKNQVDNCVVFETPTACLKCEPGYFVNKMKGCTANPINRVQNCLIYQNNTTCSKCTELYYLDPTPTPHCVRRSISVANCSVYTTDSDTCEQCQEDYYLNGAQTTCIKMISFTAHCAKYATDSQDCEVCKEGYYLNDFDNCLMEVDNCKTHDTSNATSLCSECMSEYFLIDGIPSAVCTQKKIIPNCKVQLPNKIDCDECLYGYYKSGNKCELHEAQFCKSFLNTIDQCNACLDGFIKNDSDVCVVVDVPNCLEPSSTAGECDNCAPGFFIDTSSNTCKAHNIIGCHTPETSENKCQVGGCLSEFYRDDDGQCILKSIANCSGYDTSTHKCTSCITGYTFASEMGTCIPVIPTDISGSASSSTQYVDLQKNETKPRVRSLNNCNEYDKFSDSCLTCNTGTYLLGGVCATEDLSNCATSAGFNRCQECDAGYYLDVRSGLCMENKIDGCRTTLTTSFGCDVCDNDNDDSNDNEYWKNPSTLLCEKMMLPNCTTYNANYECTACQKGYLLSTTEKRCYSKEILGCMTYGTANNCTACNVGWNLIEGECEIIDLANCAEVDSSDSTVCTTCLTGYELNSTLNICFKKEFPNCVENDGTACTKCENLYYLDTTCKSVTVTNCITTNGVTNECKLCKQNYYPKSDATIPFDCEAVTNPFGSNILNCLGNDSDLTQCSVCKAGFIPLKVNSFNASLPVGCAAPKADSPYECGQCLPYHHWKTNMAGQECVPFLSNYTGDCIQVAFEVDAQITDANTTANQCSKCRNTSTHYLNATGQCTLRTASVIDCGKYSSTADECVQCKDNLLNYWPATSGTKDVCIKFDGVKTDETCAAFLYEDASQNGSAPHCAECKSGFSFNTASCSNKTQDGIILKYDSSGSDNNNKMVRQTVTTASYSTSNIISYTIGVNSTDTIGKVVGECSSGYIHTGLPINEINLQYGIYDAFTKKMGMVASHITSHSCVALADYKAVTGASSTEYDAVIDNGDCALGVFAKTDDNTLPYCISCKKGKIGLFGRISITVNSTPTNFNAIRNCISVSHVLAKRYDGIGASTSIYKPTTAISATPINPILADYYPYDTCLNNDHLFYFVEAETNTYSPIFTPSPDTAVEASHYKCLSKKVYHSANFIDNCQVHIFKFAAHKTDALDISALLSDVSSDISCLACKPGYILGDLGTSASKDEPTGGSCHKIENCDTDPIENILMNGCAKCKDGFGYFGEKYNMYRGECALMTEYPNCYYVDINSGTKTCSLCNEGYEISNSGICTLIEPNTEDANCEIGSTTKMAHLENFSDNDAFNARGGLEIFAVAAKRFAANESCAQCKDGYQLFRLKNEDPRCFEGKNLTIDSNCAYYVIGDNTPCDKCKDGYVINLNDNSCLKVSDSEFGILENCESVNTSGAVALSAHCTTCMSGYSFDTNSAPYMRGCVKNSGCLAKNNNICEQCKKGYKLNPTNSMCEQLSEDSECYLYDKYGICIMCREDGLWPLEVQAPNGKPEYKCVEPWYENDSTNTTNLNRTWNSRISFSGSTLALTCVKESYQVALQSFYSNYEVSSFEAPDSQIPKQACARNPFPDRNCKVFSSAQKCSECYDGFFVDNLGRCIEGAIIGCLSYKSRQECSLCSEDYFIDRTTSFSAVTDMVAICSVRTVTNCKVFNPDLDQCIECFVEEYLDTSTDNELSCADRTNLTCDVFNPVADECLVCSSGYYMSSGECKPIEVVGCSIYDPNSNACLACLSQFYVSNNCADVTDAADGCFICLPHTSFNCKVYHELKDECVVCDDGYYNDNGVCKQLTIEGCHLYKPNLNECLRCMSGYTLNKNTGLCSVHTAKHCSVFDSTADSCLKCDLSSYKNSDGKCMGYELAINCNLYHPQADECITCKAGFYLSSGTCHAYSNSACNTYSMTADECTSCLPGFYLESNTCTPNRALNCMTFSTLENKCTSCNENSYMDLTDGSCKVYSVSNCSMNHPFNNLCVACENGYYLSDGVCKLYSAMNCAGFSLYSDNCVSCRPGNYLSLSDGSCKKYTKENCSGYLSNDDKCSGCISGFYLANGSCNVYTVDNCLRFDTGADKCLGCQPGHFYEKGDCKTQDIDGCHTYSTTSNSCVQCVPNHYLEYGLCFEYTAMYCADYENDKDKCDGCLSSYENDDDEVFSVYHDQLNQECKLSTPVEFCDSYSTTNDQCNSCEIGYFLENDMCVKNPTGIPNCLIYGDIDLCLVCENEYFLSENNCFSPTEEIPHCLQYSSNDCCSLCDSGFALSADFKCAPTIELSCAKWKNPSNCESCDVNEVLKLNENNNMVCVSSNINNCFEAVENGDSFTCNKCQSGYFASTPTECQWPEVLVNNCQEYAGHGICILCQPGHILSKDGTECTTNVSDAGQNCSVGRFYPKPQCSRCEGDYYFNEEGVCKSCSPEVVNCSVCNISNLSQCMICQMGYYMDETMQCIEYPPEPPIEIGITIKNISVLFLVTFMLIKTD